MVILSVELSLRQFDGLGSIARSQEYQKNKVKHVLSCLAGFLFIPHSLIVNMQTAFHALVWAPS